MTRLGTVPPGWEENPTAWADYLAGIVLGLIGGEDRWRTAPGTVLGLGCVIFCEAAVSVVLLIVQPVVGGAWCTLCLVSAFISFAIFGWGVDEPLAALQYLRAVRAKGGSTWSAPWKTVELHD
jgi:hypothetical protein